MMYNYIFDFSKSSDVVRWTMKRRQDWRRGVENPSKELLAAWNLEDQKDNALLEYYLREEAEAATREAAKAEDFNVNITSEVRIK